MRTPKPRARGANPRTGGGKKSSPSPGIASEPPELLLQSLKELFDDLDKVSDVLIVCGKALETSLEHEREIAHVLRRGGSDVLFSLRLRLSKLIEGLGEETSLTGAEEEDV